MNANGRSGGGSSTNSVLPPSDRRACHRRTRGRKEPALPGVRPDRVPEPRLVVAALEPVGGRLLHLRPAGGELVGRCDLLVHDRALAARRPDDAVPSIAEHADERVQAVEIDDGGRGMGQDSFLVHSRDSVDSPPSRVIGRAPARCAGIPQSRGGIGRLRIGREPRQPGWVSGTLAVERVRLRVRGVVQGVGFRPFVHRLAHRHGISGFVLNDADGVVVEAEGEPGALAAFVSAITDEAPPLARVASIDATACAPRGEPGSPSSSARTAAATRTTLIAPDAATCDDCLRELFDPADRRYRYPFVNCTNCGPRFTIVTSVPYDRPRTTMAGLPALRRLPPRVRGSGRSPLPRRADRLPRLRAAPDDAARGGSRRAASRAGSWR